MDRDVTFYEDREDRRTPYRPGAPAGFPPGETGELSEILRRNRWLIVGCTMLCIAAAVLYVVLRRPSYRAEAAIRIDDRRQPIPALDVLALYGGNEVSTEIEMLRSRTLAEDVVDSLGLQFTITAPGGARPEEVFPGVRVARDAPAARYTLQPADSDGFTLRNDSTGAWLGRVVPGTVAKFPGIELQVSSKALGLGSIAFSVANFDDAVQGLQRALSIKRRSRDANIVDVGYEGPDPRLVQAVPNLLARRFIADRQNTLQREARSTAAFLREQTAKLAAQLQAAEETLKRFREAEHVVDLPDQASNGVRHFAELQAQRNDLDAERRALGQLLGSTNYLGAGSSPNPIAFPTLLRNQAAASLLGALAQAEDRRSELLLRRSPQDLDVQVLTQRIGDLRAQLREIAATYLQGLTDQVAAIDHALATSNAQLQTIPAKEVRLAELERNVTGLAQIYTQLQSRLKESEIAAAAEDPSVRLVDAALLPRKPVSPRRASSIALALLAGLTLGLGAALLREQLDGAVHTRQDVLAVTGTPVLGVIPHGNGSSWARRLALFGFRRHREAHAHAHRKLLEPDSQEELAEAFVRLAASVSHAGTRSPLQVLTITSALPGEGKTTSAANLAIASARGGRRVLLIDADLRRGIIHTLFRLARVPGFSTVLAGQSTLEKVVRRVEVGSGPDLHVVTTGTIGNGASRLLSTADLATLFTQLRGVYDLILIDSPPMNVVADATPLAVHSDAVIVVARAGVTVPEALSFTLEQLGNVHTAVVRTVLNDADYRRDGAYRRAYRHRGSYVTRKDERATGGVY